MLYSRLRASKFLLKPHKEADERCLFKCVQFHNRCYFPSHVRQMSTAVPFQYKNCIYKTHLKSVSPRPSFCFYFIISLFYFFVLVQFSSDSEKQVLFNFLALSGNPVKYSSTQPGASWFLPLWDSLRACRSARFNH